MRRYTLYDGVMRQDEHGGWVEEEEAYSLVEQIESSSKDIGEYCYELCDVEDCPDSCPLKRWKPSPLSISENTREVLWKMSTGASLVQGRLFKKTKLVEVTYEVGDHFNRARVHAAVGNALVSEGYVEQASWIHFNIKGGHEHHRTFVISTKGRLELSKASVVRDATAPAISSPKAANEDKEPR